jgi:predicted DNA binding CopG/RHH family protein
MSKELKHISFRVVEELFIQLKVYCAKHQMTLQDYILSLVYKDMKEWQE